MAGYSLSSPAPAWCKVSVVVGLLLGVAALAGGAVFLYLEIENGNSVSFSIPYTYAELLPLALMFIVTLLNESMGYVHSCSLRWALQREKRLEFNSNIRLFTWSRKSKPNSWYSNFIVLIGIVFTYSSASLLFLTTDTELATMLDYDFRTGDPTEDEIHIDSIALITLGVGILFQAAISGWALLNGGVATWSSDPLDVTKECVDDITGYPVVYQDGRCMMSVHMRQQDSRNGVKPVPSQRTMITGHPHVKWVLILLWPLVAVAVSWGVVLQMLISDGNVEGVLGQSWRFLPKFTGDTDTDTKCNASVCTDGTTVLNLSWTRYVTTGGTLWSILFITGLQVIVTLSLHFAELVVNLSRDESSYRRLTSVVGAMGRTSPVGAAFKSFPTWVLFIAKVAVHWVFGLAVNTSFELGTSMYPPQIIYFAVFTFVIAIFITFLAFRRPTGYLPAAFGHIQTIANIIDEWVITGAMFWGHKADADESIDLAAFAGTSNRWLPDPSPSVVYGGPRRRGDDQMFGATMRTHQESTKESLSRKPTVATSRSSLRMSTGWGGDRHASHHASLPAPNFPPYAYRSQSDSWQSHGSHGSLSSAYTAHSGKPLLSHSQTNLHSLYHSTSVLDLEKQYEQGVPQRFQSPIDQGRPMHDSPELLPPQHFELQPTHQPLDYMQAAGQLPPPEQYELQADPQPITHELPSDQPQAPQPQPQPRSPAPVKQPNWPLLGP